MTDKLHPTVYRFISEAGNLTQSVGIGKVVGQIYAFLFFSDEPRSLNDMTRVLGISKGSASMMVRQLEQWGAVRKVWVRGDRKDYYVANEWVGGVVRQVLRDLLSKRLGQSNGALSMDVSGELVGIEGKQREFLLARIAQLRGFRDKVKLLWDNPVIQALLE